MSALGDALLAAAARWPACAACQLPRGALRPPAAGDATTTDITLVALQTFFDSFPGFETNRLFLAGQGYAGASPPAGALGRSWVSSLPLPGCRLPLWHQAPCDPLPWPALLSCCPAGHTVPLLAQAILKYNSELPEGGTPLDLQGIAVSNPWVHPEWDNMGARRWAALLSGPRCALACLATACLGSGAPAHARGWRRTPCMGPPCLGWPSLPPLPAAAVNFWFNSGLVSGATYKALLASCDMKKTGGCGRFCCGI